MKLLHIVATPRADRSQTLPLAADFLEALRVHHEDLVVTEVDLFQHDLPAVAGPTIEAKYTRAGAADPSTSTTPRRGLGSRG